MRRFLSLRRDFLSFVVALAFLVAPNVRGATFTAGPVTSTVHFAHTATLLQNGKVLIAGGSDAGATYFNSIDIVDPMSGAMSTKTLSSIRAYHTATLLRNGKVLFAGGYTGTAPTKTAELYDPATDSFSPAGDMNVAR